jgi:hypothetical protein
MYVAELTASTLVADEYRHALVSAAERSGAYDRASANAPLTTGVAKEVPVLLRYEPFKPVE